MDSSSDIQESSAEGEASSNGSISYLPRRVRGINPVSSLRRRSKSFFDLLTSSDSRKRFIFGGAVTGPVNLRRQKNYIVSEEADEEEAERLTLTSDASNLEVLVDEEKRAKAKGLRRIITNLNLVQRLLPTQFSIELQDDGTKKDPKMLTLNIYRLTDSGFGFYHTGVVFEGYEYTFCQDTGIYCHRPRDVLWAVFLGVKQLGKTDISRKEFHHILAEMRESGFSASDYHVMQRSCNSFTFELAKKLNVEESYPPNVVSQTRLGEILSPVAKVLDLAPSSISYASDIEDEKEKASDCGEEDENKE